MSIENDINILLEESKKIIDEKTCSTTKKKTKMMEKFIPDFYFTAESIGFSLIEDVEVLPITESIDELIAGETISEEFKEKTAVIFEAAVNSRVKSEVNKIYENMIPAIKFMLDKIEVSTIAEAEEKYVQAHDEMMDKVNKYLDYVVEEQVKAQKDSIEVSVKNNIYENFIHGMKTLFKESYIDMPEESVDIVTELQSQVQFLESKLDSALDNSIRLTEKLKLLNKNKLIESVASELSLKNSTEFKMLAESINDTNETDFKTKLDTLKEGFKSKNKEFITGTIVSDSPVLKEEVTPYMDGSIARYVETLNKIK